MPIFEIPLSAQPKTLSIRLASGSYSLRFLYADAPEAGWIMDISDTLGNQIVCGLPLVPGVDLLEPYAYLGFVEKLYAVSDGDPAAPPTFAGLGTASHVYVETP